MNFPPKGTEIYITMKSGAVYRGILQKYEDFGGGRILLQDVKICQRDKPSQWLICPKRGMNRKFWVSKIQKVNIADEIDKQSP